MAVSIAVVAAKESADNISACGQEMGKKCGVTYLIYESLPELITLYEKHMWRFDGFLFSGSFPRDYIVDNLGPIRRPCRCVELKDRDYYLMFARLLLTNPGLDLSRVYIDSMVEPSVMHSIFQGKEEPGFPAVLEEVDYKRNLRAGTYEAYMKPYRTMWNSHEFDVFVTRFSNLAKKLQEEQIPYVLLQPSAATILDCFYELVSEIWEQLAQHSRIACGIIEIDKKQITPENDSEMGKIIKDFMNSKLRGATMQEQESSFKILMSEIQMRELTCEYTVCPLSEYIHKRTGVSFHMGWGIGFEMISAFKNARYALSKCRKSKAHEIYVVTEDQKLVGPLNGSHILSYDIQPSPRIYGLAKQIGISPVNLEKIISLQETGNIKEFTSSDLTYYLEITQRSAARILVKLSDAGYARPVRYASLNRMGRPSTVYEIDLAELGKKR